ncbi:hypothetical protein B0J11DRAFT_114567 [Dendryphion nanum]|uniref:Uncharacterized protein n=1 Tax=Dendryphion nanum TaxID=256645 RepID=A0A9P9IDY9_9PLEO|nr:hypothetical protein B0J11DRAFT_114567 [Dendryphion nanum]
MDFRLRLHSLAVTAAASFYISISSIWSKDKGRLPQRGVYVCRSTVTMNSSSSYLLLCGCKLPDMQMYAWIHRKQNQKKLGRPRGCQFAQIENGKKKWPTRRSRRLMGMV